jgi:hypothetical protein
MNTQLTDVPKPDESRMISVTAKVTPTRKFYVQSRAKQETLSESEFINSLIDADELRQGCQSQHGEDPAVTFLRKLHREIPRALFDRVIDKLERSSLARLTAGAINALLNHDAASMHCRARAS